MVYLMFFAAFCFWFLYLLQNIIQKRNIYKVAMRNIQHDQNSLSEAYKAETELVKNIYLFIMNIRPVLIGNLFQLHEDSHDRRGRAASHYHYLIIYDI